MSAPTLSETPSWCSTVELQRKSQFRNNPSCLKKKKIKRQENNQIRRNHCSCSMQPGQINLDEDGEDEDEDERSTNTFRIHIIPPFRLHIERREGGKTQSQAGAIKKIHKKIKRSRTAGGSVCARGKKRCQTSLWCFPISFPSIRGISTTFFPELEKGCMSDALDRIVELKIKIPQSESGCI